MKPIKKISFSKSDAIHIYEWLRFYWHDNFLKHPKFWNKETIKRMGKFGGCPECTNLGVRLEEFIGEKEIKYVEKLLNKKT